MTPGGVRIGTPAVTTRGYLEKVPRPLGNFVETNSGEVWQEAEGL